MSTHRTAGIAGLAAADGRTAVGAAFVRHFVRVKVEID
jgi:hypothetical protein